MWLRIQSCAAFPRLLALRQCDDSGGGGGGGGADVETVLRVAWTIAMTGLVLLAWFAFIKHAVGDGQEGVVCGGGGGGDGSGGGTAETDPWPRRRLFGDFFGPAAGDARPDRDRPGARRPRPGPGVDLDLWYRGRVADAHQQASPAGSPAGPGLTPGAGSPAAR
jgi:hypothetical protein